MGAQDPKQDPLQGVGQTRADLKSPKWLFGHVLALGLIALFINNGFWQLGRLEQRREYNARQTAMMVASSIHLREALEVPAELPEFRTVSASGEYLPGAEVLLRGRAYDTRPGFHVLTPLVLDESAGEWAGELLLVDRGWVPFEFDEVPVLVATPPAGPVTVSGRLRAPTHPPEGASAALAPRDPPTGTLVQSYYVDVVRLAGQMPGELVPAFVELASQSPAQTGEHPIIVPSPALTEGSHFGYLIQWFSFAAVGAIGYALLLRSVTRGAPVRRQPSARPRPGRR
ncbi:MAG: SURF1 family protein [Trueperaceae bacterium]|nr:SURF1 family protein [Trueperaceae bacterium]